MPDGKQNLPEDKKEGEQGWLSTVLRLVPLVELILHLAEFILSFWR
ncbi:hypothetical protein FACS1894216_20370 [Synergistales bacterium]|nr:hypothetical protein FACS1894216_20360 [Synergistales bacterium]GHV56453.1 hypothetical protein FACS1894216_20370 [Synergistales bacterium]